MNSANIKMYLMGMAKAKKYVDLERAILNGEEDVMNNQYAKSNYEKNGKKEF